MRLAAPPTQGRLVPATSHLTFFLRSSACQHPFSVSDSLNLSLRDLWPYGRKASKRAKPRPQALKMISLSPSWDSPLARHQERRSFGAPFSALLSCPQPVPQAQSSQNPGMEPITFYEAVTSLWCLLPFCLRKYVSGPCHFPPGTDALQCPVRASQRSQGGEEQSTKLRCLQALLFWPSGSLLPLA